MDLLFFGSSDFSVPFLEALYCSHNNISMVITYPDMPQGRGKRLLPNPVKKKAAELGLRILEAKKIGKKEISSLHGEKFNGAVVVSCGIILPESFLSLIPHRCINVHPSLLPRYRGPSPITGALKNGDELTGISIMEVTPKLDAGPVFSQTLIKIDKRDNKDKLKFKLIKIGCPLLETTLGLIENNNLDPFAQDESKATYTFRLERKDLQIEWDQESSQINNKIRAYSSSPGCYCYLDKKRIKILQAELPADRGSKNLPPGTIIDIHNQKGIEVQCGHNTSIWLQVLKPENKNSMQFKDFLNGYRLKPGDSFG